MITSVPKRDIEKMLGYFAKGSNPETLARTVKSLDKAQARFVVSKAIGWNDSEYYFRKRCKELGMSDSEISDLESFADSYDLPAEYRQKFAEGPTEGSAQLMRNLFPKLLKLLNDRGVRTFKLVTRRPISAEIEMDRRNGRCYTLAYTLKFDCNGEHYEWDISNHSNEAGGSYGVSSPTFGIYQGTQADLANAAAIELGSATNESIKCAVDSILDGVAIREAVSYCRIKPFTETFSIGNYLKFNSNVDGYFTRDTYDDVHLVFEMPVGGLEGRLNTSTTFKLIGYNGNKAKIVAMVNDRKNGNKSGEIYFVEKDALAKMAKPALPRKNKYMAVKYFN